MKDQLLPWTLTYNLPQPKPAGLDIIGIHMRIHCTLLEAISSLGRRHNGPVVCVLVKRLTEV